MSEFTITPMREPQRRKNQWYAEIIVTDTGKRFINTPFVATREAALQKAGEMIADTRRLLEAELAETAR
jgi:hypothetical protein